ncbi:hypothetical protein PCC7418_1406 [Halothece sp. PCC 7418]|uniref:hypothetical protein n=1 Tax=Halothece sp. (strain PCC 7418) TaxID=65093 RepID=UPI0002A0704C|nr:hypothetical protein [Halothece sp. PCC 7418]AFZ43601.1 hypothetical protein PCC7418_1406 [Halothece sp. PCC 7418]
MSLQSLSSLFGSSKLSANQRAIAFWFGLSLSIALVYSILGLKQAFSSEYVVQDDARQHVFWMQQFVDPELFPNDMIADYFQSVATLGYTSIYKLGVFFGIEPLVFNKLLPLPLALIVVGFSFAISMQILPIPFTAFLTSTLLQQNLWYADDLPSGTPRAFFYPLLLAFIYVLLRKNLVACLIVLVLQALFYPPTVLLSAGLFVIRLIYWQQRKLHISWQKKEYIFSGIGLLVSVVVLLPFVLIPSPFDPTISFEQARQMPAFFPDGRTTFFSDDNFWKYWLGGRSGLFPDHILVPLTLVFAVFLPFFLPFQRLPLVAKIKPEVGILGQLTAVSLGLFFLAHAILFTLYLPSRYTQHSIRIILAFAAAITITIIIDMLLHWGQNRSRSKQLWKPPIVLSFVTMIAMAVLFYPSFLDQFPDPNYKMGQEPQIYEFLNQQPKDTLVVSLGGEADNIPSFARRSVLISKELAIPYHLGYYLPLRDRVMATIKAHYSPDQKQVTAFVERYGVDFWLLERNAFTLKYIDDHRWMQQFQPVTNHARSQLENGIVPFLSTQIETCSVLETTGYFVLDSKCLADP